MPPKFFLFRPTLQNVKTAFSDYDLLPALKNSLIISFSNTFLSLLVGTPCAFALSRTTFKGKKLISFWILSSRMIPPIFCRRIDRSELSHAGKHANACAKNGHNPNSSCCYSSSLNKTRSSTLNTISRITKSDREHSWPFV